MKYDFLKKRFTLFFNHCNLPILGWILACLVFGCSQETQVDEKQSKEGPNFVMEIFWPEDKDVITIPLAYKNQLPTIPCQINKQPALLLVDTGSDANCIYENHIETFDIDIVGTSNIRYTANGPFLAKRCGEHMLEFQNQLRVKLSGAQVLPASAEFGVDGILGAWIFKPLNGNLDFQNDTITFRRPKEGKYQHPGNQTE
ncbi:hypothetical protein GF373_14490 [bacterium]|nr:hypothetical protein [bacterium]